MNNNKNVEAWLAGGMLALFITFSICAATWPCWGAGLVYVGVDNLLEKHGPNSGVKSE